MGSRSIRKPENLIRIIFTNSSGLRGEGYSPSLRLGIFFALLLTGISMPVNTLGARITRQILFSAIVLLTALGLFMGSTSRAQAREASGPQRVISLSPAITEIIFALGAGDRVVGVTDFCTYPEAVNRLPRLGGVLNPNYETLITLKPDLIIHQKGSDKIRQFANQLGIKSLAVTMFRLEQIYEAIYVIGQALQIPESANMLIDAMKSEIKSYQIRLEGVSRKSVFLLLGDSGDPMRDFYTVSSQTFLGELLALAGGDNILSESISPYPKISREYVIQQSPEVIIEAGPKVRVSKEELLERRKEWQRFPTIRAVKNDQIYFIGAEYILLPGPRLVRIVDHFARAIHPELFSESNIQPALDGGSP